MLQQKQLGLQFGFLGVHALFESRKALIPLALRGVKYRPMGRGRIVAQ